MKSEEKELDKLLARRIKNEMIIFAKAEQTRLNNEQKKIEADALEKAKLSGVSEVEVAIINQPEKSQKGEFSTSTLKEDWQYEIVDESLVPSLYLSPDPKKIKEAIKKGQRKISGLNIYDSGNITIR